MAYAEKRGRSAKAWRVKYKLPSGIETSESGFETKAAVLTWRRDLEARDLHIRVINAATGELLRELILDPTRDYQPTGRADPGPPPNPPRP